VAVVLLGAAACGGDDGGETADIELEPIAAIEVCDLLDEGTAAELVGADVRRVEDPDLGDDESGCDYELADETGSGVAASMRLARGSTDDIPGGALARSMSLGDGGAVETTDTQVKVVYVVREVVVRIEVAPASGEVSDDIVEAVVDFAIETEAPVVEAITGEAPPTTEAETTTTAEETTTTTEAASGDVDVELGWSATAVEFRERIGEQFVYACPPGGPVATAWGTAEASYTDDSSVCTAAVHAGAITVDDGGRVRIQMVEGRESYPSSTANGVTTIDWPTPWPAGFLVLDAE
jgi:hypothetical protein